MDIIFEILIVTLPAIITGAFTFFITKYTYNKDIPLDKLEIAYNRVYYPLYKIISDKNINNDINKVVDKSKTYFIKYDKYIDISTKRLFKSLCQCTKEAEQKSIYNKFNDNIHNRNSYLRRRLGYLEPSIVQAYKYAMPSAKSFFRIMVNLFVVYISLIVCSVTANRFSKIFSMFAVIFILSFVWIICELMWCLLRFLYYKIRK